jgi:DNA-binding NarL/FixJ family response regulator
LAEALTALLSDRAAAEAMGARAREVFEQQAGATDRCVAALRTLIAGGTELERKA